MAILVSSCVGDGQKHSEKSNTKFNGSDGEVKLMTLDPGHFHAALIQKTMYPQIDPVVYVYAPEGEDVLHHLARIDGFNNRTENPASWVEKVYTGSDYLEKMLSEKPGNLMMVAGNNARKTEYIQKAVRAGLNVLADKPMVISPDDFPVLEQAFKTAGEKGMLLYDIMTERYEITSIVQRELANTFDVFGGLIEGSPLHPAVIKESVHHFSKTVSGIPLQRPAWFFDCSRQGEGIVDVTTHLVDLIQWACFPGEILSKTDVEMVSARSWTTGITKEQFTKVTSLKDFPEFLKKDVKNGILTISSNGEMVYKLKGRYAKVSVSWNFEASEGAGDTHFSIMRGNRCNVLIRQGREEGYKPRVYIETSITHDLPAFEARLRKAVEKDIASEYTGIKLKRLADTLWTLEIPEVYNTGHEAHFGQVTASFLQYLQDGSLPEWEVPNMITKYYTTTEGLKMARTRQPD